MAKIEPLVICTPMGKTASYRQLRYQDLAKLSHGYNCENEP